MKRKVFSRITLMLLLIGMLSSAFNIQPVEATGTIYIRADGSVDPPTAPIQRVGDTTYIFTANISDAIVVERNSIVVDGAGFMLRGLWNGTGIDLSYGMNATVKNIRITSFGTGILLSGSSGNTLSDNTVANNTEYGIYLLSSSRNTLQRNDIIDNFLGVNLDESGFNTLSDNTITNNYKGICLSSSSGNTLSGNTVTDNQQNPILLSESSNNKLSGNTVANNNYDGIWLWGSSGNRLSNNTVTTNYGHGIVLQGSFRNRLHDNNIIDNHQYGIYLTFTIYYGSTDNTIFRNTITNNGGGILTYDEWWAPSSYDNLIYHNNFIDNTVQVSVKYENSWDDGYPSGGNYWSDYTGVDEFSGIYQNETGSDGIGDTPYIINTKNRDRYPLMNPWIPPLVTGPIYIRPDGSVDPPTAPIQRVEDVYTLSDNIMSGGDGIIVERDNIIINGAGYTIEGNGSGTGIEMTGRSNVTIKNMEIKAFEYGIRLDYSSNSSIYGNNITGNNERGIHLAHARYNSIHENDITSNKIGIVLGYPSSNNRIYGNNITANNMHGIWISESPYNSIYGNNITANKFYGIGLNYALFNNIYGNSITSNGYGIFLYHSSNGIIYHNNFVNNTYQVYVSGSVNIWDDGYPAGGNYWSDYTGVDLYSGPYQNETGSDGIGDTPYDIDWNDQDRYPLMNPWTPTPPTPDFSIAASPASLTIQQGSSDTSVITITSINGFDQPVQLTVSGAPSGVTTTLDPEDVELDVGVVRYSTLTVSVNTTATLGSYTLTVTGTNGTLTHSVYISLEITALPPPEQVSAKIDSYSISPRNVTVGDDVTIGFGFTNTGNVSWTFGAGATLRKPDGTRIDFLKPVTVNPGESRSAEWTYTIDMAGRWDTVFGVWKESTHPLENLLVQTGWVSKYITAIPPGPQPILTFDLSPGWQTKELFVPVYYRSREEPGTFVLGVHNRRDMWYLVEVYRRRPDQDWERMYPWDLPYLQPWGERTFSYTPQAGDEIKIAVWNDLNDEALSNLWVLDFTTRMIFGVSISPQVTNPQEFKVKLATFYNEILTAVGYMRIGEWKKAALELGNILATSIKARESLVSVLKHVGIEVTTETINALLIPFRYIKNILSTGAWRLITNANKEPSTEEVIFTAKEKIPPAVPDVRVTKGLTIVQKEQYSVGQTITAQFTITNRGTAPITFNILTVGGHGPKGDADVRDFTFKTDITLNVGNSYNYEGELKLLDNGTYHFFIAYQTTDGKWETSVPAEAGTTNTVDIFVNPIPEKWLAAELGSPGELRVYDSQGRITGLINGVEKIEIPHSTYYENIVVMLAPADSYKFNVVGLSEGSYNLMIINGTAQEISTFNATAIPTSPNAIHRYTVDWVALTRGEKGVTIQIDSNGDGAFELTFTSDSELTHDEFMLQISPVEGLPMWIFGVAVAAIAIATAAIAVFWRRRKHQSIKR